MIVISDGEEQFPDVRVIRAQRKCGVWYAAVLTWEDATGSGSGSTLTEAVVAARYCARKKDAVS